MIISILKVWACLTGGLLILTLVLTMVAAFMFWELPKVTLEEIMHVTRVYIAFGLLTSVVGNVLNRP